MTLNCPCCFSGQQILKTKLDKKNIFFCKNCNLSYLHPFIEVNSPSSSSDSSITPDDYQQYSLSKNSEKRLPLFYSTFQNRLDFWKNILNKNKNDKLKILEVGCGNGMAVEILLKLGQDVIGFDIDKSVIEKGLRRNPDLPIFSEDIMKKDFFSKFDIVFASQVLEHFFEPNIFLKKIRSFLKEKNSLIHLDIPSHQSIASIFYRIRPSSKRYGSIAIPYHQLGYKRKSLSQIFLNLEPKPKLIKVFHSVNNDKTFGQCDFTRNFKFGFYYGLTRFIGRGGLLVGIAKF